jgi:hypothetical protein
MALYHENATLESPLVRHLLGTEKGVIQGRQNLRAFVAHVFAKEPPQRRRFRTGFLTDGSCLTWGTRDKATMASKWTSSRSWRIRDGLIQHHRVYWGWYSLRLYEGLQRRP